MPATYSSGFLFCVGGIYEIVYSAGTAFKENVLSEVLPILMDEKGGYQPTNYYVEMHNHVPPWILFKNISFGDSINLYNVLKKRAERNGYRFIV